MRKIGVWGPCTHGRAGQIDSQPVVLVPVEGQEQGISAPPSQMSGQISELPSKVRDPACKRETLPQELKQRAIKKDV